MQNVKVESLPTPLRFVVLLAQRIWFVWCCLAFLITGVVALCFYVLIFNLFSHQRASRYTYYVTKWWGKSLLAAMLVRITSEGTENVDKADSCVLVSNHLSMIDIPICMSSAPIPFSFLAKKEVDKIPVVGYLARNMHVYVDRKSKESRKATFDGMKNHIKNGHSILIYPEGTRNRTDQLLKTFYAGAFKLAIETQKPIAVLTICGSQKISTPKEPFRASPAWVHCVWDTPISTEGLTIDDLDWLRDKVKQRMEKNLEDFYTQYPYMR